jgi:hypothetical protein
MIPSLGLPFDDTFALPLPWKVTFIVPKRRRGGYVFVSWKGDHSPWHVHVYSDGELVVKWDLDNWQAMRGEATSRVKRLVKELMDEGLL